MWDGSEVLLGMCWGRFENLGNLMGVHWELVGNTLRAKGKMKKSSGNPLNSKEK
jgi:hypothetical protein